MASGSVKSAGADSLVVAGQGQEWTFAVGPTTNPTTKVSRAGKNVAVADLKPGDAVRVRYTEQDGKSIAQEVTVAGAPAAKPPAKKQ